MNKQEHKEFANKIGGYLIKVFIITLILPMSILIFYGMFLNNIPWWLRLACLPCGLMAAFSGYCGWINLED